MSHFFSASLFLLSLITLALSTSIQISNDSVWLDTLLSVDLKNALLDGFRDEKKMIRLRGMPGQDRAAVLEQHDELRFSSENEMDVMSEFIASKGDEKLVEEWENMRDLFRRQISDPSKWTTNLVGSSETRNETQPEFVYHNYVDLTYLLHKWAQMHPEVMRVASAGQSWQGREMWYIVLSGKKSNSVQYKPVFRYMGNIHGDETVGREMLVHFIYDLITNYCCVECGDTVCSGSDRQQRITKLLDTADVIIMPSINPDGFERNTRENLRNQDMNRNFPDMYMDNNDSQQGREKEVQNVMKFTRAYPVVLTANLHGGDLVANYPYDGTPSGAVRGDNPTPDDALYRQLALAYSRAHKKMFRSTDFRDGITQGSAWYSLYGGLQDWIERFVGGWALTMELSHVKTPAENTLAGFWDDNQDALLNFAEQIYQGVHGVVSDAWGSFPLKANVKVHGIDKDISAFSRGDFYRLLTPGTYKITISADDYVDKTVDVEVKPGQTTYVDIRLDRNAKKDNGGGSGPGSNIWANYSSRIMVFVLTALFVVLSCLTLGFLLGRGTVGHLLAKQLGWNTRSPPQAPIEFPVSGDDSDIEQRDEQDV